MIVNQTIKVSIETKKKLDESKIIFRETYDSVISRLIESVNNQKNTVYNKGCP